MNAALAPFALRDSWWAPLWAARDAATFVALGDDDELVALGDDVDWIASRDRALEIQNELPPLAEIEAAYKQVDQHLRVKPAPEEYRLFASKMLLDVLGIRGGDDLDSYLECLAWTMADVWPENWERSSTPGWIPIPAFAKAIKRVWEDRESWEHFGGTKRPPIPDIVERCKDYRRDLVSWRADINLIGTTQKRLGQIIETVSEYESDGEWW